MLVQLIGVQDLNFDTDDNKHIEGLKLHIAYENPHVTGLKVDSKFINADLCKKLNLTASTLAGYIDAVVDIATDINGKIIGVTPCKE
ncbi:MAG: hypothetical protein J1F28_00500 [Oscillospiraceae bacterium]|nr:hypothetical protein [Oscillospiraceae bacterium]